MQLPFDFDKAIEGLSKVTLHGGVVGKVTFALVLISVTLGGIAWTASNLWVSVAALGMVFVLAFTMLWRIINFADSNPQAALLEGAEFLVHQQIVHSAKDLPNIPTPQLEPIEPEAVNLQPADAALAQLPDQDAPVLPNQGGG